MADLALAGFACDATPPAGHPLCGGWIAPAEAVDDPLALVGVVLFGADRPIVLAAVDWVGIQNRSHRQWCERLARAAGTDPDRVALHCVHQHDAPFVDADADAMVRAAGGKALFDPTYLEDMMSRGEVAIRDALKSRQPITAAGFGSASVQQVASTRRVLGPDGRVRLIRYSACRDADGRAAPEGTIDPDLTCVSFYREDRPVARLTHYATHPMSHYGRGRISCDFPGLARYRRAIAEPGVTRLHFTGCAGDITAGKYNDGGLLRRAELADRLEAAMIAAELASDADRSAPARVAWKSAPMTFRPFEDFDRDALAAKVADAKQSDPERNRAAMAAAWIDRLKAGHPITLGLLQLGSAGLLHLPSETFVEYQLEARALWPGRRLAVAAYGDGGPWYIPRQRSFAEGGYEPTAAFVARDTEADYRTAIAGLLGAIES